MGNNIVDHKNLDSNQNIHALGVRYICNFLDRVGCTILEMNTDPDHHFQLLTKINEKTLLIAVRAAHYPNQGTIYKATQEQLIQEAKQLNAVPHFAGLSFTATKANDTKENCLTSGGEYKVIFNGISVVS